MVLDIPDHATEREAAALARKAAREKRKANREHELNCDAAKQDAKNHALKVLLAFHASPDRAPGAWEKLLPTGKGACVDIDADTGDVTLHGQYGSARFDVLGWSVSHVFESPAGVFAVSIYDRRGDSMHFLGVGMRNGVFAFELLPPAVGEWLNYRTDREACPAV